MNISMKNTNNHNDITKLGVQPGQHASKTGKSRSGARSQERTGNIFREDLRAAAQKVDDTKAQDQTAVSLEDVVAQGGIPTEENAQAANSKPVEQTSKVNVNGIVEENADTQAQTLMSILASAMQLAQDPAQPEMDIAQEAPITGGPENPFFAVDTLPVEQTVVLETALDPTQTGVAQQDAGNTNSANTAEDVFGQVQQAVASNEAESTVHMASFSEQGLKSKPVRESDIHIGDNHHKYTAAADMASLPYTPAPGAAPDAELTLPVQQNLALGEDAQAVFFEGIVEQVESAVSQQKSELFIQLKPEVLGGLAIKLIMTEEGLFGQLRTSNAQLQAMASMDVSQLEQSLKDRGITLVHMEVLYDEMANNQYLDQNRSNGQWQNGHGAQESRRVLRLDDLGEAGYEQLYESMVPTEHMLDAGVEYSA